MERGIRTVGKDPLLGSPLLLTIRTGRRKPMVRNPPWARAWCVDRRCAQSVGSSWSMFARLTVYRVSCPRSANAFRVPQGSRDGTKAILKRDEITVITALQRRVKYGLTIVGALAVAVFASNSACVAP